MKIVVLELGFENDDEAEDFADAIQKQSYEDLEAMMGNPVGFSFTPIKCEVEDV